MVEDKVPLWALKSSHSVPTCCHPVTHTHTHTHKHTQVVRLWPCPNVIHCCGGGKSSLSFITVGCLLPLLSTCIQLAPSVSIQQINNRPITALAASRVLLRVCVCPLSKL